MGVTLGFSEFHQLLVDVFFCAGWCVSFAFGRRDENKLSPPTGEQNISQDLKLR